MLGNGRDTYFKIPSFPIFVCFCTQWAHWLKKKKEFHQDHCTVFCKFYKYAYYIGCTNVDILLFTNVSDMYSVSTKFVVCLFLPIFALSPSVWSRIHAFGIDTEMTHSRSD